MASGIFPHLRGTMVSFGTFLPKPCPFAVRWHNSWFSRLLGDDISDIIVPGLGVGRFCTLSSSFSISSTCHVGHRVHFSISHTLTSWTKFSKFVLFADCRTLHPLRAVVCRPRQTREDVHILVATIQWSSDTVATWYFRNLNGIRCPKTRYCPKTWVFASLAGFLGTPTTGSCTGKY